MIMMEIYVWKQYAFKENLVLYTYTIVVPVMYLIQLFILTELIWKLKRKNCFLQVMQKLEKSNILKLQ